MRALIKEILKKSEADVTTLNQFLRELYEKKIIIELKQVVDSRLDWLDAVIKVNPANMNKFDQEVKRFNKEHPNFYISTNKRQVINIPQIFNEPYVPIEITMKNIHIEQIDVPKFLYHTTTRANVSQIAQQGLKRKASKTWDWTLHYPPAVFASQDLKRLWYANHPNRYVVRIDTTKIPNIKWWDDFNSLNGNHVVAFDDIPLQALSFFELKDGKLI